jgi:L-asparaginase
MVCYDDQLKSSARKNEMLKLSVITTGGTIEKVYSEQTSTVENLDNQIHRYLGRLRLPDCDVQVVPLMNKDSLEMTDDDRSSILALVERMLSEHSAIVITHGTDTMVQTGLYLKQAIPELKVPLVLTGAMTPLGFEGSDGLQNLTESLFAVRILDPGIYVVMHNQFFPIDQVRKERETSRFVWID